MANRIRKPKSILIKEARVLLNGSYVGIAYFYCHHYRNHDAVELFDFNGELLSSNNGEVYDIEPLMKNHIAITSYLEH